MKRLLLFSLIFIVNVSSIQAQVQRETDSTQTRVSKSNNKGQKQAIMQSLNLTKEQKEQLKELRSTQKLDKENIANDQTLTDAERKEKMKALRQNQNEKMKTILTPEQMEELKAHRKSNNQTNKKNQQE